MLDCSRALPSLGRWSLLAAGWLLAACSGEDKPDRFQSLPCDVRATPCQRSIFQRTAELRGQSGEYLPRIRTRTLAQIEEEFREQTEAPVDPEYGAWWRALGLLRLVPQAESGEVSLQQFLDNVGAYYDTSNKQITIIDRGTADDLVQGTFVLAHEFVHALQDRDIDIARFSDRWATSTDSSVSVNSLIEGEAMLLASAVLARAGGYALSDVDWLTYDANAMQGVFASVNRNGAPLLAASQLLPYPVGSAYLVDRYERDGIAAVSRLYEQPPLSLLEWTTGAWERQSVSPEPLACFPTTPPLGYRGLDHDALGRVGVFAAQAALGDPSSAWTASEGTRGDSMVLFAQQGALNESTHVAVVWRITFAAASDAQSFRDAVSGPLAPARVELAGEREVLVRAATDPSILDGWSVGCGPADELPRPLATQTLLAAWRLPGLLSAVQQRSD
jgi:hypothetical protein